MAGLLRCPLCLKPQPCLLPFPKSTHDSERGHASDEALLDAHPKTYFANIVEDIQAAMFELIGTTLFLVLAFGGVQSVTSQSDGTVLALFWTYHLTERRSFGRKVSVHFDELWIQSSRHGWDVCPCQRGGVQSAGRTSTPPGRGFEPCSVCALLSRAARWWDHRKCLNRCLDTRWTCSQVSLICIGCIADHLARLWLLELHLCEACSSKLS